MSNLGLIMEYEEILLGKRDTFSSAYINKDKVTKDLISLLKYVFEDLLEWTPTMVRDYVTPELIEALKLQRVVNKLDFPPELDPKTDLFYISWVLYPKTRNRSRKELTLGVYEKVLNGTLVKYPKGFFLEASGELNANICLQYAINQELYVKDIESLYLMFADRIKSRAFLVKTRLTAPCEDIYEYPIDYLHACLPEFEKNDLFYHYGRFLADMRATKEFRYENKD